MGRSWVLLALAFGSLLVAGCAGEAVKPSAGQQTDASDGTDPASDLGSVAGQVVDEEQRPVAGARVTIGGGPESTTEADGGFVLAGVAPGSHTLFVERLGYESLARKVEVRAGEATRVSLVLVAIAVSDEAYHVSLNKVALIHFDNIYLSDCFSNCGQYINQSLINNLRCDPCQFVLHVPVRPVAGVTEADWAASNIPMTNQNMCYYYYRDWSESSVGTFVSHWCLANRGAYAWPDAEVKNMKTATALKLYIFGGTSGVNYEHRISTWTTLAYGGELPDGFSALPPA